MFTTTDPTATLQARFLTILPTIERSGRVHFRHLDPTRREEAIAELVALCWREFVRLVERGKDPLAFPTALADYTAAGVKGGRRLCGFEKAKDVFTPATQRRRGFVVVRLPESCTGDGGPVSEVLLGNAVSPVPDQAAFRIDFAAWRRAQTDRTNRIIDGLAAGEATDDLANRLGIHRTRVNQIRREMRRDWDRFQGDDPDVG